MVPTGSSFSNLGRRSVSEGFFDLASEIAGDDDGSEGSERVLLGVDGGEEDGDERESEVSLPNDHIELEEEAGTICVTHRSPC
jgi:hypothetical protein